CSRSRSAGASSPACPGSWRPSPAPADHPPPPRRPPAGPVRPGPRDGPALGRARHVPAPAAPGGATRPRPAPPLARSTGERSGTEHVGGRSGRGNRLGRPGGRHGGPATDGMGELMAVSVPGQGIRSAWTRATSTQEVVDEVIDQIGDGDEPALLLVF